MGIVKQLSLGVILVFVTAFAVSIVSANDYAPDEYHEMTKGNDDSDFTIIEYASFTCPHCATFHKEILPYLEQEFINTGKAKFIYREVYFDAPGLWAGLLARCGSKEKYFGIVDLLYKKQEKWASGETEKEVLNQLFVIGRQVGMTEDKINSCFQNKKKSLALIDAYLLNSKSDQITSTPSLLVNGKLIEYASFDDLKEKLSKFLE